MQRRPSRLETVHIPVVDSVLSDGENLSELSTASSRTDKLEDDATGMVLPKIKTPRPRSSSARNATKSVHFVAFEDSVPASGGDKSNAYLQLPPLSVSQDRYPEVRRNSSGNAKMRIKSPVSSATAAQAEERGFKVSVLLQEHIFALKKAQTALTKEARNAILEARIKDREEKMVAESKRRTKASRRVIKSQASFDSSKSDELIEMTGKLNEGPALESEPRRGSPEVWKNNFVDGEAKGTQKKDANIDRGRGGKTDSRESADEEIDFYRARFGKEAAGELGGKAVFGAQTGTEVRGTRRRSSVLKKADVSLMERYRVPRDTRNIMEELRKLGKTAEIASLKELLESQELAEKEMRKALKKEKILEKEEQKKREKEEHDRIRRETHYQKMEELAKEEAEKRETVMKMKETKKLQSLKRQKKNLLLWNEIQTSILSTRTTRAYKFSYYPLMPYKTAGSSLPIGSPSQTPEPSVSTASGCSSPADSVSSLEFASSLKDWDRNGLTNEREE